MIKEANTHKSFGLTHFKCQNHENIHKQVVVYNFGDKFPASQIHMYIRMGTF